MQARQEEQTAPNPFRNYHLNADSVISNNSGENFKASKGFSQAPNESTPKKEESIFKDRKDSAGKEPDTDVVFSKQTSNYMSPERQTGSQFEQSSGMYKGVN